MEVVAGHWDRVYATKDSADVSCYQSVPTPSLDLIARNSPHGCSIIDVGAGASVLVDHLIKAGHTDVTVLDVSSEGLDETRARLGSSSRGVTFVVADLLSWAPERTFRVWHDRAVFHFLTNPTDRSTYVRAASLAVEAGGAIVLGVFAEDGPEQCSGLPTARYDPESLAALFTEDFVLAESLRDVHQTPWGSEQPFTWVVLRRRGATA